MNRFEVKDVYVSDVVLDPDTYCPKRTLNIQVELNYEAQPNFRGHNPTPEEIAKELGDTIAQSFLDIPQFCGSTKNTEKKEILIRPQNEPGCFGWYNLKEFNEKIIEEES